MKYIETFERDGVRLRKKYRQDFTEVDSVKGKIRQEINDKIFDVEDSIADTTKVLFLLMNIFMRLYKSNFEVGKLSLADKAIIDYFVNQLDKTITLADLKFKEEGTDLIDKLLKRQKEIADIIEEVKNG